MGFRQRTSTVTLALTATMLTGCYLPPFWNADLPRATRLQVGESTPGDVAEAFGKPDELDTPRFKVYTAHHDDGGFAMGGPSGGGGVGVGNPWGFRVVARYDDSARLNRLEAVVVAPDDGVRVGVSKPLFSMFAESLDLRRVATSDDGHRGATLAANGRVEVRDAAGSSWHEVDPSEAVGKPTDIVMTPDGMLVAVVGRGVGVWSTVDRRLRFSSRTRTGTTTRFVDTALTDEMVWVAERDVVRGWSLRQEGRPVELRPDAGSRITRISVSRDGTRIAAATRSKASALVWEVRDGTIIARLPKRRTAAGDVAFLDPGGTALAVAFPGHVEIHDASDPCDPQLADVIGLPSLGASDAFHGANGLPRLDTGPGPRFAATGTNTGGSYAIVVDPDRRGIQLTVFTGPTYIHDVAL